MLVTIGENPSAPKLFFKVIIVGYFLILLRKHFSSFYQAMVQKYPPFCLFTL